MEERATVLFESPQRLVATLETLQLIGCANRFALVARELTKMYETWQRGTVTELTSWFQEHPPRGEIVLILAGKPAKTFSLETAEALLEQALAKGDRVKQAAQQVATITGLSKTQLYNMALTIKKNSL